MTDLTCIRYTSNITILSKLNNTNELYTSVPKDRNQPSWDVLKETHGPNSSSQRIEKREISSSLLFESQDANIYDNMSM